LVTLEGRIATSTLRAHPRSMVRRAFRNVKTSRRARRADGVPFTLRNYSQFIIQCRVSPAASMHLCVCSLRPQTRRWETRVWVIRDRALIRRWNIPQRKWVGLPSGARGRSWTFVWSTSSRNFSLAVLLPTETQNTYQLSNKFCTISLMARPLEIWRHN